MNTTHTIFWRRHTRIRNATNRRLIYILASRSNIYGGGQHHFPEGCIITKDDFEDAVRTAHKILSEKSVNPSLVADFEYYVKLYQIYFAWSENGRDGDFYELCRNEGIEYKGTAAFYYD